MLTNDDMLKYIVAAEIVAKCLLFLMLKIVDMLEQKLAAAVSVKCVQNKHVTFDEVNRHQRPLLALKVRTKVLHLLISRLDFFQFRRVAAIRNPAHTPNLNLSGTSHENISRK